MTVQLIKFVWWVKCVVDSVDSRGEERERCVTGIQALVTVPYPVTVSEKMALHARWRLVELLQVLGQRNTLNQPLLINVTLAMRRLSPSIAGPCRTSSAGASPSTFDILPRQATSRVCSGLQADLAETRGRIFQWAGNGR